MRPCSRNQRILLPYVKDGCLGFMRLIILLTAIGTSCRALQTDKIVHCIDALGTTTLALPSATTGLIPSATPVLGSDQSITYSPSDAWKISDADSNCSMSKSTHMTNTVNGTISFNFTGKLSLLKLSTNIANQRVRRP